MQTLSTEMHSHLFSFLPVPALLTCRSVCTAWKPITEIPALWRRIALSLDLNELGSSDQELEALVKDYLLNKRLVLSNLETIKKKITKIFDNLGENETIALRYLSATDPRCSGFYIKTRDAAVAREIADANTVEELCQRIANQLTIVDNSKADQQDDHPCSGCGTFSRTNRQGGSLAIRELAPGEIFNFSSRFKFIGLNENLSCYMFWDLLPKPYC